MSKPLQLPVILRALRHHKAHVSIICLQIAFTMSVLANLVYVIAGDMQRYRTGTGIDESRVGVIQSIGAIGVENPGTASGNLYALRAVPGVAAAAIGLPPLWRPKAANLYSDVGRLRVLGKVYRFQGSQGYSDALGVRVVAGRNLTDGDAPDVTSITASTVFPALITEALAAHLYHGESALGKQLVDGSSVMQVVGIIDHLSAQITGSPDDDYAVLTEFGVGPQDIGGSIVIRSEPGQPIEDVLKRAARVSEQTNPGHVVQMVKTMEVLRDDYFRGDKATSRMIALILAILLVVAAFGLGGISAYWVQQRRRQIGVMRALGASRGDVLFYFHAENFLVVALGLLLGIVLTYLGNHLLMVGFEAARIPLAYVLFSVVFVWLLGQAAVLIPAIQAARVAPASATQS